MTLLRRILMLCMSSLPYALHAQSDLAMTSDLFAMFPPTLTAKEAQEKWETTYKTKCFKESEEKVICKTKETEIPKVSEIELVLNPKERSIEMLTVQPSEGEPKKMHRAETIRSTKKYAIRCDKNEVPSKIQNFQIQTKCHGNGMIDLIVKFEDKNTPSIIDFDYQSSKIIETMERIAPSTEHPDVWLKAVSAFKEMTGTESRKPAWFNGEYVDYQFFPFGSFYFKTKHEGTKHTIEASWMEP